MGWNHRDEPTERDSFGSLFRHFRRILALNNQILEMIGDLERALGGDYIFDHAFLENSVSGIIERGRQVLYHLNAMASERYTLLYDRFTTTSDQLTDILAGGPGPYGNRLVLAGEVLHRDLVHLAGGKGAHLGETRNGLQLPTPPLFVLSVTGYRLFMADNGLFDKINRIVQEKGSLKEQATRIKTLFDTAQMPLRLTTEITRALKDLDHPMPSHFAVRSSAVGEDGERSFAGQFHTMLTVKPEEVVSACQQVMASRFSERLLGYLAPEAPAEEAPMAVVVQPMLKARASGVLYTRDPANPAAEVMVVATVAGPGESLVAGQRSGDRFIISRRHPFTLQASTITGQGNENAQGLDRQTALTAQGLRQGSGLVGLDILKQLAEYGLLLEKRFETPQDIEWCLDDERLWLLQCRPLHLTGPAATRPPAQLAAELARLPVLLTNLGHVCQLGLACGRIMQVTEETAAEDFPVGAVAVSRYASPRLAGIVRRASALITDIGSPTGHLATIAREYRTPALFGTTQATQLLTDGLEVVVDVEERTVFAGHIELPAEPPQSSGFEPRIDTPETGMVRRLLRLIAPLNLLDPTDPGFQMAHCQTIHDFLRFCHEKAVAELIDFHTSKGLVANSTAPLLQAEIPLKIRLIDVGDGLLSPMTDPVPVNRVASLPFKALLQGLLNRGLWDREPTPFGMKDFLSSLSRPLGLLHNSPAYNGENLAIIAANYCNLSLRLGYHFNIIDSYLSDEPDDNYIYFRFVGGFAEEGKRKRRALLISQILAGLHFKVERKGDLVLGKAKMLERPHLESILTHLGELIAFTRQLDVKMADDDTVTAFFNDFLTRIRQEPGSHGV